MRECLFIGGCLDGKRKEMPDEWEVWNAAPAVPEETLFDPDGAAPANIDLRVDQYVRVRVNREVHVFLCGDRNELLLTLIEGYRRDKGQH